MLFKMIIYDDKGHIVYSEKLGTFDLLIAGIQAEDIFEQYHQEHPCEHCIHEFRVLSDDKGGL